MQHGKNIYFTRVKQSEDNNHTSKIRVKQFTRVNFPMFPNRIFCLKLSMNEK